MNELVTRELESETSDIVARAQALPITSPEQRAIGAAVCQTIKKLKAEVHETFDKPCDLAHKAWKSVVAARDKHLGPLERADAIIKDRTGRQLQIEENTRLAAIRQAQEKAEAEERQRRKIEADKLAIANAEAARVAAAKAAELKKSGDLAAAKRLKAEEASRQAEAKRLAEALAAAPVVVATIAPPPVAKIAGQTSTVVYDFEIVDQELLPQAYLLPNMVAIGKVVRALKDQAAAIIPGIRVTKSISVGTR